MQATDSSNIQTRYLFDACVPQNRYLTVTGYLEFQCENDSPRDLTGFIRFFFLFFSNITVKEMNDYEREYMHIRMYECYIGICIYQSMHVCNML